MKKQKPKKPKIFQDMFLYSMPKVQETKARIIYEITFQSKGFYTEKEKTARILRSNLQNVRKCFPIFLLDLEKILRIDKECIKHNIDKINLLKVCKTSVE